jgi:hypothetical protein
MATLPILPNSRDAAMIDLQHAAKIMRISPSKARAISPHKVGSRCAP